MSANTYPTYVNIADITVTDPFFSPFLDRIRTVSAPDILKKFLAEGAVANYERVARGERGGHVGPPWYHGLICECIRGISDLLVAHYDKSLDDQMDAIIEKIAAAQAVDPEGYINPYTTLMCPDQRWGLNGGNIRWQHETYDAGALVEAGVHHFRATGKTSLLKVAVKMANYLASVIGPAPKWNVTAEHSLPEMALAELEQLVREYPDELTAIGAVPGEYLRLACALIDNKGHNEDRHMFPKFLQEYAQDHRPAREQREAIGHAVRATLFYTGMAAVALETGDAELAHAADTIWHDIAETKLHINGCVGAKRDDERFGQQYDLPNNAYLETCAGVGLAMFGAAQFRIQPDASVWDVVENTLTNLIPASVSESGDHYTYENPLESRGGMERWNWHGCPCCPPMLLKITGAMPSYIWAKAEDDLWLNLFIGSEAKFDGITAFYKEGKLTVTAEKAVRLHIRIPEWARNFALSKAYAPERGYAVVELSAGTSEVTVTMDAPVQKIMAHPWVGADTGRVAIRKGAVLYCAEQAVEKWEDLDFELGDDLPAENADGTLTVTSTDGRTFTLIEYRRWNNHGALPMRIWFRQRGHRADPCDLTGWEGKLYRVYSE